eukprot:966648-Pelagomonas_calceolata.AAC.1
MPLSLFGEAPANLLLRGPFLKGLKRGLAYSLRLWLIGCRISYNVKLAKEGIESAFGSRAKVCYGLKDQ